MLLKMAFFYFRCCFMSSELQKYSYETLCHLKCWIFLINHLLFLFPTMKKKLDLMHTDLQATSLDLNYDGSQSPGSGGSLTQQTRNKRMRTSFKHHQLRTMKSYFAINQNPDAKDLKQLSQKTGLSKRVLQVIEQFL